ncbi:hypothetical protein [Microcoleus sp. K4-B3]
MEDDNTHYIIEDANGSTNIHLAYEYTESVYKARKEDLDNQNGKLGTFLGFGGLLLRFAADLPGENTGCLTCLILKVMVCGFSAASIFACATGLTSNKLGHIVKPKDLMTDYWYNLSEERCRAYIINTWVEAIEVFEEAAIKKGQRLNIAIWLLAIATIAFALDLIIASVLTGSIVRNN